MKRLSKALRQATSAIPTRPADLVVAPADRETVWLKIALKGLFCSRTTQDARFGIKTL
ncbi:hypothetical protein [Synechococcus sp. PCC 7335]|uniref:hypothetical protein n=1 Tax=Synechococcus sp. (strain ATCC 29403 / PCC 7335) TaxID=91464 RepID=UPI0012FA8E4E|nr:hypothetical protein [Synechococcus sp. PCC 7335]